MTAINWDLSVPFGYGQRCVTLRWLYDWLLEHHHPEYVERLTAWLNDLGGHMGVGGGWRDDGTQPDRPGFAPEGRSFHQNQRYSDGFIGAAAVDLVVVRPGAVHRAPYWSEVPAQGSPGAALWGVHCNVGVPGRSGSEPWHLQPTEIDGYDSWVRNGSPAPAPNYPFPGRNAPTGEIMLKTTTRSRIDSRTAPHQEALDAGETREVWLTLPGDACAAIINVVVLPKSVRTRGWLAVAADEAAFPGTTVNWSEGTQVIGSQMTVPVVDKKVWLHASRECDFVIDVTGLYFG